MIVADLTFGIGDFLGLSTVPTRLLESLVVLVALAALSGCVSVLGRPLKSRYSSRLTEATQAGVMAVGIVIGVGFIARLWGAQNVIGVIARRVGINRLTAVRTLLTVATGAVTYLVVRLVNRSIDRLAEEHDSITDHQSEVAYHVVDVGLAVAALLVVLAFWGVDPNSLFLSAGVFSAIVGLGARSTIGALIAGFVLLFSRPFRVGDWIEVEDYEGVVEDVTLINTKLRTANDAHVLIPNDEITSNPLINRSERDRLRIDREVGVDYDTDPEHAIAVAESAMGELEALLSVPDPEAFLVRFGDSAMVLEVRFWIDKPSARRKWRATTAVITAIDEAFEREGISIPFPQRTLRNDQQPVETTSRQTPATDGGE